MKLTTLKKIFTNSSSFLDKEVSIGGWVRSNRDSKAFGFLMISDDYEIGRASCRERV